MFLRALLMSGLLLSGPAFAGACDAPAHAAEQAFGIPNNLLAAIGRVESGRREAGGTVAAWPWSVNAAGQGYYLGSAAEAMALVASLRARGVQSIDVGCFQVNLMYHPNAFATLEDAFDPASNARAAGHFLAELRGGAASWDDAVARYHSANPDLGLPYMRQVLASWTGGAAMAHPPLSQVAMLVRVIVPSAFGGEAASRFAGLRLPVVITPRVFQR